MLGIQNKFAVYLNVKLCTFPLYIVLYHSYFIFYWILCFDQQVFFLFITYEMNQVAFFTFFCLLFSMEIAFNINPKILFPYNKHFIKTSRITSINADFNKSDRQTIINKHHAWSVRDFEIKRTILTCLKALEQV